MAPQASLSWRPSLSRTLGLAAILPAVCSFCPKGFGEPGYFPQEWKIPVWPELASEAAGKLRTVTFEGFKIQKLNEEFLEGPTEEFNMQGRETYWQVSGEYFLYYCQRFRKWRIAGISAFGKNMNGDCFGFVSDYYPDRDIQNSSLIKGWIEIESGEWQVRKDAGVASLTTLQVQMDALAAADGESGECGAEDGELDENGQRKANCPVMPVVRKVGEQIGKAAKSAGKWVRRLFPSLLPAPEEDEEQPAADSGQDSEAGGR